MCEMHLPGKAAFGAAACLQPAQSHPSQMERSTAVAGSVIPAGLLGDGCQAFRQEGSWRRVLLLLLDRVQHRKEQGWVAPRGHRLAGRVGRKDSCCPAQLRSSTLQKQQLLLATELKALPTFSLQCPCPCVLRGQRGRDVETRAWLGGERFCRISEKLLTVDAWRNCQPKPNHR